MKRLVPVLACLALVVGVLTTTAFAKGASEALIAGPGLGGGVRLGSDGDAGSARLSQLAEDAGFYPSVFATSPNPVLTEPPAGELGPRYTITYTMPGPNGDSRLRQDVYPYAQPNPVTHTDAGQRYFGTQETVGGWFVAASTLKDDLVAAGLPATPPGEGGRLPVGWAAGTATAALVAALLAAAALLFARRRSPAQPHATT